MFFHFLRYINPTWYFHLLPKSNFAYFPDFDLLDEAGQGLLEFDRGYSNRDVSKMDAAYQAWQKGFIISDPAMGLQQGSLQPTVSDNYRFVRRYFHRFWSWYVLGLRLLTFHNPVREICGFLRQSRIRRINLYSKIYPHPNSTHNSQLTTHNSQPKVSVIIPTLNRYSYLKDALHDLEKQDYPHFDVLVIDQSEPFQPEFYDTFQLNIKVIRQQEKALWLARNVAIKEAKGDFLLLFDDDSRIEKDWITKHLKCLDHFGADISSGVSISLIGAPVPRNYSFFRWSDQVDTGNVMIHRKVFEQVGLFDRQFEKQRQGDGEFGLRAYLAGFKNISNPYAKRFHLKVGEGGLRQMGHWDGFRPKNWLAPRPVPSVLYLTRKYFGNQAAIFELLINVPPSLVPYRFKGKYSLLLAGSLLIVPLLPLVLWQVLRSWRQAGKMFREGAKIEKLTQYEKTAQNP